MTVGRMDARCQMPKMPHARRQNRREREKVVMRILKTTAGIPPRVALHGSHTLHDMRIDSPLQALVSNAILGRRGASSSTLPTATAP